GSWLDLLRLLDDRRHHPALAGAERTRLGDGDLVADLGFVLLVVREEGRRAPLGLPVQRVAHLPLDRDLHRLVHLVADDDASDDCLGGHRFTPSPSRAARSSRAPGPGAATSACGPPRAAPSTSGSAAGTADRRALSRAASARRPPDPGTHRSS